MSNFFSLNKKDIYDAIIVTFLIAFLSMLGYVQQLGSIYLIDYKVLLDIGSMSLIGTIAVLVKSLLTNNAGKFMGKVGIK